MERERRSQMSTMGVRWPPPTLSEDHYVGVTNLLHLNQVTVAHLFRRGRNLRTQ